MQAGAGAQRVLSPSQTQRPHPPNQRPARLGAHRRGCGSDSTKRELRGQGWERRRLDSSLEFFRDPGHVTDVGLRDPGCPTQPKTSSQQQRNPTCQQGTAAQGGAATLSGAERGGWARLGADGLRRDPLTGCTRRRHRARRPRPCRPPPPPAGTRCSGPRAPRPSHASLACAGASAGPWVAASGVRAPATWCARPRSAAAASEEPTCVCFQAERRSRSPRSACPPTPRPSPPFPSAAMPGPPISVPKAEMPRLREAGHPIERRLDS